MIDLGELYVDLNILGVEFAGASPVTGATKLQVQRSAFNAMLATGANDAFVVNLSPAVTVLTAGLMVVMDSGSLYNLTNTPTLQVNALSPVQIYTPNGLVPGDIPAGEQFFMIYNENQNKFQLLNPWISTADTSAVQNNGYVYAIDTGAVNAYVVTLSPVPVGLPTIIGGLGVIMRAIHTNTSGSTITVNGISKVIRTPDGALLVGGEIKTGGLYSLLFNNVSDSFVLMNSSLEMATTENVQFNVFNYSADTGTANHYVAELVPTPASLANGLSVQLLVSNTNTAASALNVNGIGEKPIVLIDGTALLGSEMLAGSYAYLSYNIAIDSFQLTNSAQLANARSVQSLQYNKATAYSFTSNTFLANIYPAPTAYVNGLVLYLNTGITNTGACTINVNGLGAIPIWSVGYGSALVIAPGDFSTAQVNVLIYNLAANCFYLQNPAISTASTFLVQENAYNSAVDTGTANAYAVALTPAPLAITNGFGVIMQAIHTNTGASTINVNGTVIPILNAANSALTGGEIAIHGVYYLLYNASLASFVLLNSSVSGGGGGVTAQQVQQNAFNYGVDTGVVDAYIVNLSPAVTSLTDGLSVSFVAISGNDNTINNPTLQINGLAPVTIGSFLSQGGPLLYADVSSYTPNELIYNAALGVFVLMNPAQNSADAGVVFYGSYNRCFDLGTVNAVNLTPNFLFPGVGQGVTQVVAFKVAYTNTSTSPTLTMNSGTPLPILLQDSAYIPLGALYHGTQIYSICRFGTNNQGTLGWVLLNPQTPGIVTAPAVSASSSLTVGAAYHNTLGYDVVLTVYLSVTAATTASILLGVGSTSTPTQQTIVSGLTVAAVTIIPVTIYLPADYYALLSTSGTITETISGQQVMPV